MLGHKAGHARQGEDHWKAVLGHKAGHARQVFESVAHWACCSAHQKVAAEDGYLSALLATVGLVVVRAVLGERFDF